MTEDDFEPDGAQIFMDTRDSEIELVQERSQSQEEEEPGMLVLPKQTFTHEESTEEGSEEQTQEWAETEVNGESADARTDIQDQIQESDDVEKEESSPTEVQSDQSQDTIITSRTEPAEQLSDLTNISVGLEEAILTQEQDKMSTSVTDVTEMSQNNDIQGLDLSEQVNKQDQEKYIEQMVNTEQKAEPENGLPEEAQESELEEPDESESSEQIQCSDEQKPCEQTPQSEMEPPECPDPSIDLKHVADEAQHEQDMTSVHHVTEEVPVLDTNPAGPCINGSAEMVNRAEAQRLAERLYRLDGFQRTDVVRHLDKE